MIEDRYVASVPSDQNALDLFKGEWSSAMPGSRPDLQAGAAGLFEDSRITWGVEQLGGLRDRRVLELGPLEGAHTFMAEQLGAASVIAVEANVRAYLRCLVVKEIFGLHRSRFLLGDFLRYLEAAPADAPFDVCLASGVLYHMADPIRLLRGIRAVARSMFLWTHYYDDEAIRALGNAEKRFPRSRRHEAGGRSFTLHEYHYGEALGWTGFCGSGAQFSCWMERADLLAAVELAGFRDVRVGMEQRDHPYGPALCLVAS